MRPPVPPTGRSVVVLLLQPGDDALEMYAEFLRFHQLTVIGVTDPWAALIAAPQADVIVTGALLGGSMDGIEFIARLRQDERTIGTPVIVLTSCASKAARERAEQAGCDVFLSTPCLPDELLQHVQQVLTTAALRRIGETSVAAGFRTIGARASVSAPSDARP